MPIYEYSCAKCGVFEAIQKASDKPLKVNPDCKRPDCPKSVERMISHSAFHLKGSGWYKSDYAPSGSSGTAKAKPAKKEDSTSSTSESKSESAKKETSSGSDSGGSSGPVGGCGSGCGCH